MKQSKDERVIVHLRMQGKAAIETHDPHHSQCERLRIDGVALCIDLILDFRKRGSEI